MFEQFIILSLNFFYFQCICRGIVGSEADQKHFACEDANAVVQEFINDSSGVDYYARVAQ